MLMHTSCFYWILLAVTKSVSAWSQDYCSGHSMKAECPDHKIILMQSALYGRMHTGTCLSKGTNYTGCGADVLHIADTMCSGKTKCEIRVTNPEMDKYVNCNKDFVRYLSASYKCELVFRLNSRQCNSAIKIPVSTTTNHIQSIQSHDSNCGLSTAPYYLEALPGQHIVISMVDFNVFQGYNGGECFHSYGDIIDLHDNAAVKICPGSQRVRKLYVTKGNKAQIVLNENAAKANPFLIQVRVTGCPNLVASKDSWVKRDTDTIVVGCHNYRQTWHLKCQGHKWIGVIGNCSKGGTSLHRTAAITDYQGPISHAVSIFLIVLVAVVISAIIVTVGVFCSRRSIPKTYHHSRYYEQKAKSPGSTDRGRYMHISSDPDHPMGVPDYCSDVRPHSYDVTLHNSDDATHPDEYLMSKQQEEYIAVDLTKSMTDSVDTVVEQWVAGSNVSPDLPCATGMAQGLQGNSSSNRVNRQNCRISTGHDQSRVSSIVNHNQNT